MRLLTLAGLAVASTGGLAGVSFLHTARGAAPSQAAATEGWLTDFPTAQAAARQSGKPLFVLFR